MQHGIHTSTIMSVSPTLLTLAFCGVLVARNAVTASVVVTGSVVVNVPTYGQINGLQYTIDDGTQVDAFLGLPYAKPPVGSLRFSPPVSLDPIPAGSTRTVNATTLPASCTQIVDSNPIFARNTPESEDCLYLNVWRPANRTSTQSLAVMVWIYGGGYTSGTSTLELYDGKVLSSRNGVIVASMQYRVGPIGFLALGGRQYGAPGNAGLLDQQLALKWIHDNIDKFGGDSNRVTLFGESAGSASVGYHLLSPGSAGLFRSAIMESGAPIANWACVDPSQAAVNARVFAARVKCSNSTINSDKMIIDCLRTVSVDQFWNAKFIFNSLGEPTFAPTVDGSFISQSPNQIVQGGSFPKKSILIGVNKDEGSFFLGGIIPKTFDFSKQAINVSQADYTAVAQVVVSVRSPQAANFFVSSLAYEYEGNSGGIGPEWLTDYLASSINLVGDDLMVCPVVGFARAYAGQFHNNGESAEKNTRRARWACLWTLCQLGLNVSYLASSSVYTYTFNHRTLNEIWPLWSGVVHGDEIQYVFGLPFQTKQQPWFQYTDNERNLSDMIMYYWTNFAKNGDPNQGDRNISATVWPRYNLSNRTVLVLDTASQLNTQSGLRERKCDYWLNVVPQFQNQAVTPSAGERLHPTSIIQITLLFLMTSFFINKQ